MLTTLPMALTLSRIVAIPVLVALFYVEGDMFRYIACVLYTAAAVTDYLDGYFARAWKQQSKLGRIFDPIADKLLVSATILMLVAGLREFLAEVRALLPVSKLAKWKTGIQMTALGFLIVGDAKMTAFLPVQMIGEIGMWLAAALTLITGYDYLATGLEHLDKEVHAPPAPPVRPKSPQAAHEPAKQPDAHSAA
jgi:cardiolipin synthase